MTRPTPHEDAVRSAMRTEREELSDSGPAVRPDQAGGTDGGGTEAAIEPDASVAVAQEPEPEDELAVAQRERGEYLELAKRTQADFENYRKRAARDVAASAARARIGLIREFLPVLDNLERALSVAPEGAHDAFVEGVRLVHRDLQGALQRAGVETIEPRGEAFDPNVHEALSMRPEEDVPAGTVLDVVEKGYRTADLVVRPARVVVAS